MPDRWDMGRQLVRAADSIGANIAEATGRWTQPDARRFLLIARGSLNETRHWVLRAQARGLVRDEYDELLKETGMTLNGLIRRRS